MTRDKNQPFCLVVALTGSHAPWVMGDPSAYLPNCIPSIRAVAVPPQSIEGASLSSFTVVTASARSTLLQP